MISAIIPTTTITYCTFEQLLDVRHYWKLHTHLSHNPCDKFHQLCTITSSAVLALKSKMCCNAIDVLGDDLNIMLTLHLFMCNLMWETLVSPLLPPVVEPSHVGRSHRHTCTSAIWSLLSSLCGVCAEPHIWCCEFFWFQIALFTPCHSNSGCPPSHVHFHKQTKNVLEGKASCFL